MDSAFFVLAGCVNGAVSYCCWHVLDCGFRLWIFQHTGLHLRMHFLLFTWFYDAGFLFLLVWLTACFWITFFYCKQRITVLLSVTTMLAPFVLPYCDPFFRVTVFSIGQADCTLITEPFFAISRID